MSDKAVMTEELRLHISAVVSTKNEEAAITHCLSQLIPHFDQIIVVDSNSSDKTPELATSLGAEVVNFTWNGEYPKKKQWCLDNLHLRNDWVIFIDADESPTRELTERLAQLQAAGYFGYAAFDIPLRYAWQSKVLLHGQSVKKRALINRNLTWFPRLPDLDARGMGELEGHYQPKVNGRVGRLEERILHLDPDPIRQWFDRHNGYSDWEAFLRVHSSERGEVRALRSRQGAILDRLPGKPFVIFLYNYVVKAGFRDGRAGLDYALALAFYQWQIGVKVRDFGRFSTKRS